MREVALADAKNGLSALIQEVEETGEEILITRHGRQVARLGPVHKAPSANERRAIMARIIARRDEMAASLPQPVDQIPWETVKGWMYGEDED